MLADFEIDELLSERKLLPANAITKLKNAREVGCRQHRAVLKCKSESGKRFSILAQINKKDGSYSVHVRIHIGRRKPITLVRCNRGHGPHTNWIEKRNGASRDAWHIPKKARHIHLLTQRYQESRWKDLGFAVVTKDYSCFESAIEHVCYSYGFYFKDDNYGSRYPLFKGIVK